MIILTEQIAYTTIWPWNICILSSKHVSFQTRNAWQNSYGTACRKGWFNFRWPIEAASPYTNLSLPRPIGLGTQHQINVKSGKQSICMRRIANNFSIKTAPREPYLHKEKLVLTGLLSFTLKDNYGVVYRPWSNQIAWFEYITSYDQHSTFDYCVCDFIRTKLTAHLFD